MARFHGQDTAVLKYANAKQRSPDDARWTQEVGFVERHKSGSMLVRGTFAGHYVDVDEVDHVSQKGAAQGAVTAGLIGVLAGPPGIALGLLVGGIFGAEEGRVDEAEAEPEDLAEQLRSAVPRDSSAIVLIAQAEDVEQMIAALADDAQDVIRRTLTVEEEAALKASISAAPQAAAD